MTCGTQLVQEKEGGKGDSRWPQRNLLPGFEGCGLGEEAGKGYTRNLGKPGGKNWRVMEGGYWRQRVQSLWTVSPNSIWRG